MHATRDRSRLLVVGVDGSRASVCALTSALERAAGQQREVEVVTAWRRPDPDRDGSTPMSPRTAYDIAVRTQASTVAQARAAAPEAAHVGLTAVVAEGEVATVLVAASRGASSLVLGAGVCSASSSAASSSGGVREHCRRKAACCVVVVPEDARPTRAPVRRASPSPRAVDVA